MSNQPVIGRCHNTGGSTPDVGVKPLRPSVFGEYQEGTALSYDGTQGTVVPYDGTLPLIGFSYGISWLDTVNDCGTMNYCFQGVDYLMRSSTTNITDGTIVYLGSNGTINKTGEGIPFLCFGAEQGTDFKTNDIDGAYISFNVQSGTIASVATSQDSDTPTPVVAKSKMDINNNDSKPKLNFAGGNNAK